MAGGVYSPMDGFGDTAIRPDLRPTVGLVLTGGGARSAYQVGVLRALAELLPRSRNPFQIIVGTSAGAVAAGVLAAEAHHWRRAVAGLEQVWANFRSSQVFHVDARHMMRAGAHWVLALVSGVRARRAAGVTVDRLHTVMPTPGEIFGYMLDTLFTDQIYGDLEQLERINTLVHSAPQAARGERPIETLMLAPSVDPREIASRHVREMPQGLRVLLRVIGGRDESGYQLASYLMFEAGYTRALIELGYRDAMEARSALMAFMSGEKLPQVMTAAGVAQAT